MLEQAHSLSASGARRAAGLPGAILVGLVAVAHLLPIWAVEYLPHVDGPTHLYNVWLLREYWTGKWPALAELYRVNHWWVPTWFGHLVLHGLTAIFPYLTAQKLFVSAYLLALPFALVYASKGVGGGCVLPRFAAFERFRR